MPDLTIQVQEVKGLHGTALVILAGSIDAKTVITFQTHLNSVKERGIERFVLDMENVKYVNSTGLGYLINLSDSVTPGKGGISLVKVQPKVKVVFDMLGLNAFFKIFPTRDEAIKHLMAEPAAGGSDRTVVLKTPQAASPPPAPAPPPTRPTQFRPAPPPGPPPFHAAPPARVHAPAPPAAPVHAPPAPVAQHTPAPAPVVHQTPAPAQAVHQTPAPAPVVHHTPAPVPAGPAETIHVECQACKALLAVRDVGTYKCPRCLTPFNYVGGGHVSFLPRQKALPVQLSLNFSPECTDGLLEFVRRLTAKSGFSTAGISEVQAAVKETVETIKRHAYGGNDNNVYHVLMLSVDSELELRFADYGASLNSDKGDLFGPVRKAMDRFDLKHHPKGGNVVTLSKKAK